MIASLFHTPIPIIRSNEKNVGVENRVGYSDSSIEVECKINANVRLDQDDIFSYVGMATIELNLGSELFFVNQFK